MTNTIDSSYPGATMKSNLYSFPQIAWRVLVTAIGYMLVSALGGLLIGRGLDVSGAGISLLSGVLIGALIGPQAVRLPVSPRRQFVVWGSALLFNALSLGIEGAFYAPGQNPMVRMPVAWTAFLFVQSLATGALIAWLFRAQPGATELTQPSKRAWYSWTWRYIVSSFSYLFFYFIFGAVNYALVTKPYYQAHVSGLAVPAPQTVLLAELVRAPLIVLSIVPLILAWRGRKSTLAVFGGLILFVIGGVIPLLTNTALPDLLRFASAIEIFFQNFLTGVVAVLLLSPVFTKDSTHR